MSTGILPSAGDWIRGITVQQPYATCILAGAKTIENRPRPWSWRGWMLLHAGQRTDAAALHLSLVAHTIRGRELTAGAVLGIARLTDCHQDPEGAPPCTRWAHSGAWHLVLADVQELPLPVPATGQLGPWRPTPELLTRVIEQLPDFRP
ncbi:hypothetical protein OZK63_04710 [Streptomyces sp. UMAF16]|nr:hypothetical protein [Streptomyces sp. UMAF16]